MESLSSQQSNETLLMEDADAKTIEVSGYEILPSELRLKIWELVAQEIGPRIITITEHDENGVTMTAPPVLLSIGQVSRYVGLKYFDRIEEPLLVGLKYFGRIEGQLLPLSQDLAKFNRKLTYFNKNRQDRLVINYPGNIKIIVNPYSAVESWRPISIDKAKAIGRRVEQLLNSGDASMREMGQRVLNANGIGIRLPYSATWAYREGGQ